MHSNKLVALLLSLVTIAGLASGCGGSRTTSSGTATTAANATVPSTTATTSTSASEPLPPYKLVKVASGTPLSRTKFIATADAICADANRKVDTVSIVTRSELPRAFPEADVYEKAETAKLSKLVPPASLAHDWELIISDFHRYAEYADLAARYSEANNLKAAIPLFKPAETVHEHLNTIAKRDGFKVCSGIK